MKMTEAMVTLRKAGVKIHKTNHGEYRVNVIKGGTEATAYYTDDLEDAVNTGLAMAEGGK
jgi:hypothetical protein